MAILINKKQFLCFFTVFLLFFLPFSVKNETPTTNNLGQSMHRKDKVKRLSACMKLSKTRQHEDKRFYHRLLSLAESHGDPDQQNKSSDFIAFTIVMCYTVISDKKATDFLEAEKISSLDEDNKDLLKLEKWKEYYENNDYEEIENEILRLQEKVLEVVSLSKEAEILQQNYYNIREKNRDEEGLYNEIRIFLSERIEISFNNMLLLFAICAGLYYFLKGYKKDRRPPTKGSTKKTK